MSDTFTNRHYRRDRLSQAIKVMLNTVVHHYYGAEAYSKHPSGSVRGQWEEETH